jgi:hypothetical protein
MPALFSVDDAFTVGASFDLVGGYLLGRGLLASPSEIARRGGTYWGYNAAETISQVKAGADARVGLTSLGIGFMLQAGGYVALIAGARVDTGAWRAIASVALSLVVSTGWYWALRGGRLRIVKRLCVGVARASRPSGGLAEAPDGVKLLALGQELGYLASEAPGIDNPGMLARYAKQVFGVDRVENQVPSEALHKRS